MVPISHASELTENKIISALLVIITVNVDLTEVQDEHLISYSFLSVFS